MLCVNEPKYAWLVVYQGKILDRADSYQEIYEARAYHGKGIILTAEEFNKLKKG